MYPNFCRKTEEEIDNRGNKAYAAKAKELLRNERDELIDNLKLYANSTLLSYSTV